ncbi:MAG: murein L,D-transpeptidase catalytic domain family protein, partial [Flavobacteriales bacterium]|nr:murein L,D-transpeptidase catalytic domain family protein [Flavobacteriales bacterium]
PPSGWGARHTARKPMLVIPSLITTLFAASPALPAPAPVEPEEVVMDAGSKLYLELGLEGSLPAEAFLDALERREAKRESGHILAIADFSRPSTEKRLYIIDLEARQLVLRTYVAHGANTGELYAEHFSNREGSHQSSLGLYRVGAEIVSPKHGAALLLHGLDRGVNDKALEREIIMHGADYVSEAFIAEHGRLGRSWGCPAVPREHMQRLVTLLADGGLLFVYGG